MIRVFVAGPINTTSRGEDTEQFLNVARTLEYADAVARLGMAPYVPALCAFWQMMQPQPRDYWMKLSLEWLEQCSAFFRCPGKSIGADLEQEAARSLGLVIFTDILALEAWGKRVGGVG